MLRKCYHGMIFEVRPCLDCALPEKIGHRGEIALHRVEIKQECWRLEFVYSHGSFRSLIKR
jgi:hypothetical protein